MTAFWENKMLREFVLNLIKHDPFSIQNIRDTGLR